MKIYNLLQQRVINTIKYSVDGLTAAWKTETAFKIEIIVGAVATLFIICSDTSKIAKIFLLHSILLVMIIELINTGLEKIIDHLFIEIHPKAKVVKDLGSAAVFVGLINLIITWAIVFIC